MSTVLQIITDSLKKLGVVAPGESLDSDTAADGMRTLNQMLGGWNNNKLTVLGTEIEEFSLVANQNSYTLGSGGDFNTSVPSRTDSLFIKNGNYEDVIEIVDAQRWGEFIDKGSTSDYPTHAYIDNNYPLRKIYLYPTPASANTLIMHNERKFSSFSSLTASVSLPDGYERAIINNLAIELASEYGKAASPDIVKIANSSLADIKRINIKPHKRRVDAALLKGGSFNIRKG